MSADGISAHSSPCGPAERVLEREGAIRRCVCGTWFLPARGHQTHCCPRCRKLDWQAKQHMLDFAPQVSDPRIPDDERDKLRSDVELVLARLEQGPATTAQLAEAAPRSMAIHSRIADVRALLAPHRTVTKRRLGPRLYEYRIERVANMPSTEGR